MEKEIKDIIDALTELKKSLLASDMPKYANTVNMVTANLMDISNRLEKLVMQGAVQPVQNADFTASELMIKMNEIIEEYPAQGNYAEDGRYTYPDRWNALLKYIKEKR